MPKLAMNFDADTSLFELRRRRRRFRMIVDLTGSLIMENPELSHREALCLVRCARKAIQALSPAYLEEFDASESPKLDGLIRARWPLEELDRSSGEDVVN